MADDNDTPFDLSTLLDADASAITPAEADTSTQADTLTADAGDVATTDETKKDDVDGTPANDTSAATEAAAAAAASTTKVAPGTPDKAMQKIQQDVATSLRLVSELTAKLEAGGTLTPKEADKFELSKQRLDQIRNKLRDKTLDPYEDGVELAQAAIDQADRIEQLERSLAERESRVDDTAAAAAVWSAQQAKFPGVDVKAVWEKSIEAATALCGDDASEATLKHATQRIYEERATNAVKAVKAKTPPAAPAVPAKKVVPATPNGARFVVPASSTPNKAAVSEDDHAMNLALSIVEDD